DRLDAAQPARCLTAPDPIGPVDPRALSLLGAAACTVLFSGNPQSITVTCMSQPPKAPSVLELYPEETREAADLLKQAIPHMVRHDIPPNPVHYALWYTYSK